ncbi:acylphosphatase [Candidatus Bathyarchaeota archaeon]|nr:acylphosphatase [Candidatus Bathyarchaeota archaeon]
MKVRAHVFVSGLVQGVFFRWETRKNALKHNVKGWVRNLWDGRVEAVFEGEEEDVKKMIKFCEKGPPEAKVENIEVKWEKYKGEYATFEII